MTVEPPSLAAPRSHIYFARLIKAAVPLTVP